MILLQENFPPNSLLFKKNYTKFTSPHTLTTPIYTHARIILLLQKNIAWGENLECSCSLLVLERLETCVSLFIFFCIHCRIFYFFWCWWENGKITNAFYDFDISHFTVIQVIWFSHFNPQNLHTESLWKKRTMTPRISNKKCLPSGAKRNKT